MSIYYGLNAVEMGGDAEDFDDDEPTPEALAEMAYYDRLHGLYKEKGRAGESFVQFCDRLESEQHQANMEATAFMLRDDRE